MEIMFGTYHPASSENSLLLTERARGLRLEASLAAVVAENDVLRTELVTAALDADAARNALEREVTRSDALEEAAARSAAEKPRVDMDGLLQALGQVQRLTVTLEAERKAAAAARLRAVADTEAACASARQLLKTAKAEAKAAQAEAANQAELAASLLDAKARAVEEARVSGADLRATRGAMAVMQANLRKLSSEYLKLSLVPTTMEAVRSYYHDKLQLVYRAANAADADEVMRLLYTYFQTNEAEVYVRERVAAADV
jgi:hypothetical protein